MASDPVTKPMRGFSVFTEPDEGGGWIAWCDDLPGAMSQGETEVEALDHLGEAIGLILSVRFVDAVTPYVDEQHPHQRTLRIA